MIKRVFTITAGILKIPFVGKTIERFTYKVIREKVRQTDNPYDDLAVDLIWQMLNGDIFVGDTLKEFIMNMAELEEKNGEDGRWTFLANAILHEEESGKFLEK